MRGNPVEKTLFDWEQQMLDQPAVERGRVEITWLPGVELGGIKYEVFDPATGILHAMKAITNVPKQRIVVLAHQHVAEYCARHEALKRYADPFPSPPGGD